MKFLLALLLMTVAFPALAQNTPLSFADGALIAELSWLQGPRTGPPSEMKIEWKEAAGQTRVEPPGAVKVILWMWMGKHGHGSRPTTLTKLGQEPGVYQVSNMFFTMGGRWDVRINLKYTDGREETQLMPLDIP